MSISPIPPPSSDAVPPSDAVGAGLTQLRETLTELADAPVWPLDDDLLMRRLTDAMAAKASLDQIVGRLYRQSTTVTLHGIPERPRPEHS